MAQLSEELVVAGDGAIYVAPVGSTEPTSSTSALNDPPFTEVGFVTEDGVAINNSRTIEDKRAWQSRYPLRRLVTDEDLRVTFSLEQWTEDNVILAFGGGYVEDLGGGEFQYHPPTPGEIDDRMLVVEWNDDDKHYRLVVPKGLVVENVETNLTRTDLAVLPITFAITPVDSSSDPWYLLTDDPGFEAAS